VGQWARGKNLMNNIQELIDRHHETRSEVQRPHLGCSMLGGSCDRWIWLSFRWAIPAKFPGRILRLFRRGQLEELTIISDLKSIGMVVKSQQIRVNLGCHVSGSLDAIIESGLPGDERSRYVAEFKTHNKKSFNALEKNGVEKAKKEHFIQMQLYMHGTNIDRALYVAVCKDDDRIYTEIVSHNPDLALKFIKRGHEIALSPDIPLKLSDNPCWYECKWCDAYSFCHETGLSNQVNCRTCRFSVVEKNDSWYCEFYQSSGIPPDFQREGCDNHVLFLVPWKFKGLTEKNEGIFDIGGEEVINGCSDYGVYSSKEILSNPKFIASIDYHFRLKNNRDVFDERTTP
jgi:hypothetical protein